MADVSVLAPIAFEDANADLKDNRLYDRLVSITQAFSMNPVESYPKVFTTPATLEGFYRLLSNRRLRAEAMIQPHLRATLNRAGDCSCVLAIHDLTCIDYDTDSSREGLGFSMVPKRQGYIAHVSLRVDNDHNLPLGVGAVETVTRKLKKKKEKLKKKRRLRGRARIRSMASLRFCSGSRIIRVL